VIHSVNSGLQESLGTWLLIGTKMDAAKVIREQNCFQGMGDD